MFIVIAGLHKAAWIYCDGMAIETHCRWILVPCIRSRVFSCCGFMPTTTKFGLYFMWMLYLKNISSLTLLLPISAYIYKIPNILRIKTKRNLQNRKTFRYNLEILPHINSIKGIFLCSIRHVYIDESNNKHLVLMYPCSFECSNVQIYKFIDWIEWNVIRFCALLSIKLSKKKKLLYFWIIVHI